MENVLITGASGGIGQATADAFARAGYGVALHYCRGKAAAEETAARLRASYGVPAIAIGADLLARGAADGLLCAATDALGFIGTLVNNAGIARQQLFTDITDEDWDEMLGVHLTGTFRCCRAALPAMLRRHEGAIVNVSSMWGQIGGSCEVHYSAAKAGVIGLTKALAKEVALSGITVNCVAPGVIRTAMLDSFSDDDLAALAEETPSGRLGTPEDVAASILYLASPAARFVTGQVLGVNGGFVV